MPKVNFVKIGLKFHQELGSISAISSKLTIIYQRPESLPKTASGFLVEALSYCTEMTKLTCFCHICVKWQKFHILFYISEMTQCTCFVTFWSNVAIYALCRIWLKCRDLRALLYLAEMLRFMRVVAFWLKCCDLRVLPGTKCLLPGT